MTPQILPSRILVAIDTSPERTHAVCMQAEALAGTFGAAIILLHVAPPLAPPSMFDPPHRAKSDEDATRLAGQRLLEAAAGVFSHAVQCSTELLFGDPAAIICRRADELNADLIIVGSRGLGPLGRLFLGSVSSAVCQNAPCSVLVVRESG